jgi:hypothetical protein
VDRFFSYFDPSAGFRSEVSISTRPHVMSDQPGFLSLLQKSLKNKAQNILDNSVPYTTTRWALLLILTFIYGLRVYYLEGFYIITYGLALSLLNLLIGFLSPIDSGEGDGPILPTGDKDEYKPFVRKLPEFKFWYECSVAISLAFFFTFFSVFNVPVFWPILLIYFIMLFCLTMKKQFAHMRQHNYVPFSFGKKKYGPSTTIVEDIRSK